MIKKQKGQSMNDAELIRGVVIDKNRVSEDMPKKISKAKVALIATPLEITKTQVKAKIKISTADQISLHRAGTWSLKETRRCYHRQWRKRSSLPERHLRRQPSSILAKTGIFAIEDVPEKDMKYAARALHATIVGKPET